MPTSRGWRRALIVSATVAGTSLAPLPTSLATASTLTPSAATNPCATNSGPIKIGVEGPESGLYSIVGNTQAGGLAAAIASLGSQGINGRKVEMVNKDDLFSPTTAVENFQQMVNEDGICGMVGPTDASSTLAVAQANGELPTGPIPQVGDLGDDEVMAPGGPGTTPRAYTFAVLTGEWPELELLTNAVEQKFAGQKIGIIHDPTAYGVNQADFTIKLLGERGIKVVASQPLPVNTPDPTPQVSKVLAAGAKVLFVLVSYDDAARIAKAIKSLGATVHLVCTDQCAVIPQYAINAGAAANGTISTNIVGSVGAPSAGEKKVTALYNKIEGAKGIPANYAFLTYDAAQVLFKAWKTVGTDPPKVFKYIEAIHHYSGLSCPNISFSAKQHNGLGATDCYALLRMENGVALPYTG